LSESNGNGGVRVSSWVADDAAPSSPATDQLDAQAVWGLGPGPAAAAPPRPWTSTSRFPRWSWIRSARRPNVLLISARPSRRRLPSRFDDS